ncbi:MAG: anhydro-N-acetylmuramic acid kinase [Lewinella sp.]|nr:anhydro-N-acetylmuramic acid kinase [Lewinella sp.]
MPQSTHHLLGLMSGTSLDGLDIAYCQFTEQQGRWSFTIPVAECLPYPPRLHHQLQEAIHVSAPELLVFDIEYGRWLGEQAQSFIKRHALSIDFIASHGHTVFHQPERGLTYQIGSGQALANASGYPVVADFRTKDVLLGGEGAPLVPLGDRELFGDYDFCLNLGGIANISYETNGQRIAFDIAPANMLLNHLAQLAGRDFDIGGRIAASGHLQPSLFEHFNALPYYRQSPPKSLGYEWFTEELLPLLDHAPYSLADQLCTSVHHTAHQITLAVQATAPVPGSTLLATGGGARNEFLIDTLQSYLGEAATVIVPDPVILDFKEALVFAFLGLKRKRNEVNCLASVTGASSDNVGGVCFYPG